MKIKLAFASGAFVMGFVGLAAPAFAGESSATMPSQPRPEAGPTNVSSTDETGSSMEWAREHLTAGYVGTFHGASLNDPGSSYTLDHNGFRNTQNAVYIDSTSDLSYLLTKHIGVGGYVPFFLVPAPGQHFVIGDVGVQAFDRRVIGASDSSTFRVSANLILQAPTSDYSQARKQTLAVKTTPSVSYAVPRTNFSLGTLTEGKAYLDVNSGKTFKLWALPYVRYAIGDSFALSVAYEMEADHFYGKPTYDFSSYQTDLQPGVVWWITRKIMFNPYVQIFTGTKVSLDNTALGAVFSARAF